MLQARIGSIVRTNVVAAESSLLPISGTFSLFLPSRVQKKQQARHHNEEIHGIAYIYKEYGCDAAFTTCLFNSDLYYFDVEIARGEFVRASLLKMIKARSCFKITQERSALISRYLLRWEQRPTIEGFQVV